MNPQQPAASPLSLSCHPTELDINTAVCWKFRFLLVRALGGRDGAWKASPDFLNAACREEIRRVPNPVKIVENETETNQNDFGHSWVQTDELARS